MITEREAVRRAWELVNREKIRVRGLRSARLGVAPGFLPKWTARGDVWEVVFDLNVPVGMSPDIAVIMVDRETGEAATVKMT